jgi:hypothetical protein
MSRGKVSTTRKSILYIFSPILTSITVFPKMFMRVPLAEIKYPGPLFNVSMLLTNVFLITLVVLPVSTRARTGVLLVLIITFINGILMLLFLSPDDLAGTPSGELDLGAPISLKGYGECPDSLPRVPVPLPRCCLPRKGVLLELSPRWDSRSPEGDLESVPFGAA